MKILVTNHWLKKLGGSETFTYTLVKAAKEWGADVDLFTFHRGIVSDKINKDFGVNDKSLRDSYDLILSSHCTTVKYCCEHFSGPIIQTIHGTIPKLEQPDKYARAYVAVSEEIREHICRNIKSPGPVSVIRNSIDLHRFRDRTQLAPGVKSVLSLSHCEKLNNSLAQIFTRKGILFQSLNKYKNPVWEIEKEILQHDLVISLGRGALEAFACGRPVLVLDHRPYQEMLSDGMAMPWNLDQLARCNFSGRYYRKKVDLKKHIDHQLELYNDDNQIYYRHWALENLNYKKNFQKYLELFKTL